MVLDIIVHIMFGLGLSVFAVSVGNGITGSFEYNRKLASAITGIFLGACSCLFNLTLFSYDGNVFLDVRVALLILTAICFDKATLIAFLPLYFVGVFFSEASIINAAIMAVVCLAVCLVVKKRRIYSILIVAIVVPVAFAEAPIFKYIGSYDENIVLIYITFIVAYVLMLLLAVFAAQGKNIMHASFLMNYFEYMLTRHTDFYTFKIDKRKTTVTMSEECEKYLEFNSRSMPYKAFVTQLQKSATSEFEVLNNCETEMVYVTPKSKNGLYIRYACFKQLTGGYHGFIYDMTSNSQKHATLNKEADVDYSTGLPTYSVIRSSIADRALASTGKWLFATIQSEIVISKQQEYSVEFEIASYSYLAEMLAASFSDAQTFFVKSGDLVFSASNIKSDKALKDYHDRLLKILDSEYSDGSRRATFDSKLGMYTVDSDALQSSEGIEDTLKKVQYCKYRLKHDMNGSVYMYSEKDYNDYLDRQKRIKYLPEIFKQSAITLAFQPIVEILSGKTCFYEVLMRVTHPAYTNTAEFVGNCISEGLDVELDEMIIHKLLQMLDDGLPAQNFTLNLLGNTSINDDVRKIAAKLNEHGKMLYLEFTEHIKSTPEMLVNRTIQAEKCGARLIADDYGIDNSNLELLYTVDFDVIKIPRNFVECIENSPRKQAVVKNVTDYCRSMNIKSVAEGAETLEEVRCLKKLNVDFCQGYFFDKPKKYVPVDANMYDVSFLN